MCARLSRVPTTYRTSRAAAVRRGTSRDHAAKRYTPGEAYLKPIGLLEERTRGHATVTYPTIHRKGVSRPMPENARSKGGREEKSFLKYGGVEFELKVPEEEVNTFVANLPEHKRESMYEVAKELSSRGMIEIPQDAEFSTIDSEYLAFERMSEAQIHDSPLADSCPSCRTPLRFTSDVEEGAQIECAECGANLVVTFGDDQEIDVRLASELEE